MLTRIAFLIGLLCAIGQANALSVIKCTGENQKNASQLGTLTLDLDRQLLKSAKFNYGMDGEKIGLEQLKTQHGVTAYRATYEDDVLTFYVPEDVPIDPNDSTQFRIKLKWWSDGDGDHLIQNFTLVCQNIQPGTK
jgi:hypothetical protein